MIYLFLADGFEEIEALTPLDILRRAGLSVTSVGVGKRVICGSHGIEVAADCTTTEALELVKANPLDAVILPGGMPGTLNLQADETVNRFIADASAKGKPIGAICAAPIILGELGLLSGREAICFPGFEEKLSGARISDKYVVTDGNIITARGMGVALEFSLAIVEKLINKDKAAELFAQVQAH